MPELLKEVEKLADRRLRPQEREEWDDYLTKQKETAGMLASRIDNSMNELNDRVYKLFRLTADDIKVIQGDLPVAANESFRPIKIQGGPISDDIIRDRRDRI